MTSRSDMMGYLQVLPIYLDSIRTVQTRGACTIYRPTWSNSDAKTLAVLEARSDVEYVEQRGGDDHDVDGNCIGHEDEASA